MSSSESMSSSGMSSSMSEQWEPLKDFEDDYEIEIEPPHRIRRISSGWIAKPTLNKQSGYIRVYLNGKTYLYHRILAKQFIPNPDDLPEIDHINQIKTDNRLDNLRWVDRSKNLKNRVKYVKQKSEFLDYPHDYSYDYTVSDIGSQIWNIDHVVACPFLLTIYGPVTDPRILIDGRVIEVYTTLESNEYLILDSRDHTIIKYLSNGTTQNLYNNRYMEESVFDPIGPGPVYVTWTGTFGFDITAYIERNEPRWRSRQA